jgi:hypothetical protein
MGEFNIFEGILCGVLSALTALLFVEYFGVPTGFEGSWLILINLLIIFVIAWQFRFGGVFVAFILIFTLGYAAYGPYYQYLREPMDNMRGTMVDLPNTAGNQFHCISLIFSNPQQYITECQFTDQQKQVEEDPLDLGLEIHNFRIPNKIYPGISTIVQVNLENKGDYDALNTYLEFEKGKYDECKLELFDIIGSNYKEKFEVKPGETFGYRFRVRANDPWDESNNCKFAKNKNLIGGDIGIRYSYDYQTESSLEDIKAIRNVDVAEPDYGYIPAKEKAAPANIIMGTVVPLIWKDADVTFKEGDIRINFINERKRGNTTFRGKYVRKYTILSGTEIQKNILKACDSIYENDPSTTCYNTFKENESERKYDHCSVKEGQDELKKLDFSEEECSKAQIVAKKDEDENFEGCYVRITIEINESVGEEKSKECEDKGGTWNDDETLCIKIEKKLDANDEGECNSSIIETYYQVLGTYKRSEFDTITLYVVGDDAKKYVNISCNDESTTDIVICCDKNTDSEDCLIGTKEAVTASEEDKVVLIWKENEINLKPGEERPVYNVKLKLVSFPTNFDYFYFSVKADATYRVSMADKQGLSIYNPHYT